MKITENKLRKIIKKVILESPQNLPDLPTNFERAYEEGHVDQGYYYSNAGGPHRQFPGYYYTENQAQDAKAISSILSINIRNAAINAWCSENNLNEASFNYICKQEGCLNISKIKEGVSI